MNNPLLHHIKKIDRPSSKLELIEMWCKLSIKNQKEIIIENDPIKLDWNEGYLDCLKNLEEVINESL